ncbi:DUF5789 family protein [Halegenticoccus tardaugens]|uniref:DUF5789 family protein n=1 Tax=Halegenticoccus tardaugens TaxID=2071624 RepID=UPI00100B8558|nr:hypothetical protein [Halegenticoccus tardaugens]
MRLSETYRTVDRAFDFPIVAERLTEELGDRTIASPNGDEETIGEVVDRCSVSRFYSAKDVYEVLLCHVTDAYVGRKFYDDRAGNPHYADDLSF